MLAALRAAAEAAEVLLMKLYRAPVTGGGPLSRPMSRREAVATAFALGASLAWPFRAERRSLGAWRECRDCYPQGVASGDPSADGVILWTRRPPTKEGSASRLLVEIAADEGFRNVVSTTHANVSKQFRHCRWVIFPHPSTS